MYIQEGLELLTEFSTIGTDMYRSKISNLNFKRNTDAAEKINTWIKEITNDKISNLVSSGEFSFRHAIIATIIMIVTFHLILTDDFDEGTKLVLINAIYFNGKWLNKFDAKNTQKKTFHATKNEKKLVPMMFNKCKYNYGEIPQLAAKYIELPYMVRLYQRIF